MTQSSSLLCNVTGAHLKELTPHPHVDLSPFPGQTPSWKKNWKRIAHNFHNFNLKHVIAFQEVYKICDKCSVIHYVPKLGKRNGGWDYITFIGIRKRAWTILCNSNFPALEDILNKISIKQLCHSLCLKFKTTFTFWLPILPKAICRR